MKKITLTLPFILLLTGCWDTGTGEKVGQIIKLNRQGMFCQTYEGELIRGGMNNGSGASSTLFDFTVEDTALLPIIQEALDKQYEVKLHYRMEWTTWCRSDSNFFLTSVEKLSSPGHSLEINPTVDPKEGKRKELQRELDELH